MVLLNPWQSKRFIFDFRERGHEQNISVAKLGV
jgi:hypothetical protein